MSPTFRHCSTFRLLKPVRTLHMDSWCTLGSKMSVLLCYFRDGDDWMKIGIGKHLVQNPSSTCGEIKLFNSINTLFNSYHRLHLHSESFLLILQNGSASGQQQFNENYYVPGSMLGNGNNSNEQNGQKRLSLYGTYILLREDGQ